MHVYNSANVYDFEVYSYSPHHQQNDHHHEDHSPMFLYYLHSISSFPPIPALCLVISVLQFRPTVLLCLFLCFVLYSKNSEILWYLSFFLTYFIILSISISVAVNCKIFPFYDCLLFYNVFMYIFIYMCIC